MISTVYLVAGALALLNATAGRYQLAGAVLLAVALYQLALWCYSKCRCNKYEGAATWIEFLDRGTQRKLVGALKPDIVAVNPEDSISLKQVWIEGKQDPQLEAVVAFAKPPLREQLAEKQLEPSG